MRIEWVKVPEFKLIQADNNWNKFECFNEGFAILHYLGKQYLLDFPVGWVSDMTSSPLPLRSFLPQLGPHVVIAIIHDRALDLGWSREWARIALLAAIKSTKNVKFIVKLIMNFATLLYDLTLGDFRRKRKGIKVLDRVKPISKQEYLTLLLRKK